MVAAYPRAVRNFSSKRNIVDDVDASHVNDLQEEMAAVQSILGSDPHKDGLINGIGKDYKTVRDRMFDLARGKDNPFTWYRCAGVTVKNDGAFDALPLNGRYVDTHSWETASSTNFYINVQRAGIYWCAGEITFSTGDALTTWSNRYGRIALSGSTYKTYHQYMPPNLDNGPSIEFGFYLDLRNLGYVGLSAAQDSGGYKTVTAKLGLLYLRD